MPERRGAGAILIDLDGVIRHWPRPFDAPVEAGQRRVEDEMFALAFAPALLHRVITGRIGHAEWLTETIRLLGQRWPDEHARQAVAAWASSLPTVDPAVRDLVASWRRTVPVVLVTNATDRLEWDLAVAGLDDAFDAIVNSSHVGHAKPDPTIFAVAVGRTGVPPEQTVFIDDSLANVEAAIASGLIGYRFDGDVDRLRAFVRDQLE